MAGTAEYMTVQGAAKELKVSRRRIWQLIKGGYLHPEPNPLDGRSKLIPATEVNQVARLAGITQGAASRRRTTTGEHQSNGVTASQTEESMPVPRTFDMDDGPVDVPSTEIEDFMREHWTPDR
jgi:hypothetical protein